MLRDEYTYEALGQKLSELRPADAGKDGKEWFSLQELQGRIAKIVEQEKSNPDQRFGGEFGLFRQTLGSLQKDQREHKKHVTSGNPAHHCLFFFFFHLFCLRGAMELISLCCIVLDREQSSIYHYLQTSVESRCRSTC